MSEPILLSDDEQDSLFRSPHPTEPKKRKIEPPGSIFIIDDDPTPVKPGSSSTPFFVPETPMSGDFSIVKCSTGLSNRKSRVSDNATLHGISSLICLESDNESESGAKREDEKENETLLDFDSDTNGDDFTQLPDCKTTLGTMSLDQLCGGGSLHSRFYEDNIDQAHQHMDEENFGLEKMGDIGKQKNTVVVNAEKEKITGEAVGKRISRKDEKLRSMEENKRKKEEEKLRKAALKAEEAEMKRMEKETQKWEKGKLAVKSIVAEIDAKVVELGLVGGHLLSRFAEKGLTYRVTSNPVGGSIVWTMNVPEQISQLSPKGIEIPYVLFVYEAEEFCKLLSNDALIAHVLSVRSHYPSHTICYLVNRLLSYVHKKENGQYKNPTSGGSWTRPPIEEVLSKLTSHFHRVHSRLCIDEAELAEHIVGLTNSLATCQFRKKLTRLSVSANGAMVSKDSVDKKLIKKNIWLKALVAIPKVQPRFAMAIWKKYPTMKSLLSIYMDHGKSVHEKEFLLKDLMTEGLVAEDRRLGEICSKRIYRILMAQNGSIKTDDVEDGADFFQNP